jgi:hypothetical protein
MKVLLAGVAACGVCLAAGGALAQSMTAYQTGARIAQARGAANVDCYAKVFARHAQRVEQMNGRLVWLATSTPQYNNELERRCGFDRRTALRSVSRVGAPQPVYRAGARASANGHTVGGAYGTGLKRAYEIGHPNPGCYAQVWSRYAYPVQPQGGQGGQWWRVDGSAAFRGEIRSQCG